MNQSAARAPVPITRRERRKQEVRGRITEAAISLFSERGCESVTVEDVCEVADVARKTFYNYFPSKQDLIRELSESLLFGETSNVIDMAMERYATTSQRLDYVFAVVETNLANYEQLERSLIQQTLLDVAADVGRAGLQLKRINDEFERLLIDGVQRGDVIETFPVRFLAEIVVGCMNAVVLNWVHDPAYPVGRRAQELRRYLSRSILA